MENGSNIVIPTEKMEGWRIYYADGTTIDSSSSSWEQAPDEGVEIVMIYEQKPYRNQYVGFETYALEGGGAVKLGEYLPDEEFYALQARAVEDEEWPGAKAES